MLPAIRAIMTAAENTWGVQKNPVLTFGIMIAVVLMLAGQSSLATIRAIMTAVVRIPAVQNILAIIRAIMTAAVLMPDAPKNPAKIPAIMTARAHMPVLRIIDGFLRH